MTHPLRVGAVAIAACLSVCLVALSFAGQDEKSAGALAPCPELQARLSLPQAPEPIVGAVAQTAFGRTISP